MTMLPSKSTLVRHEGIAMKVYFRKNLLLWVTLAVLTLLFILAARGMATRDWVITLLRGCSVCSVTFLVASGFSLFFGLLDVLNLAHGTLFMIGAYIGWTVYVRPDTFIDLLTPLALLAVGFVLMPLWKNWLSRVGLSPRAWRVWPWIGLALAVLVLFFALPRYPVTIWNPSEYANSPV